MVGGSNVTYRHTARQWSVNNNRGRVTVVGLCDIKVEELFQDTFSIGLCREVINRTTVGLRVS